MSGILGIALHVFLLLIVLGFAGWVLIRSLKRSDAPTKLVFKWIFTGLVIGYFFVVAAPAGQKGGYDAIYAIIVTLVCGFAMAITWRHSIIDLIANPLASLYDGGREEIEPKPYYSVALSKRKLNRPFEAIAAVREQLAKFPNDFEGISLLASIQAEDTKDLPGGGNHVRPFLRPAGGAAETGCRRVDADGGLALETGPGRGFGARIAGKNHREISRQRCVIGGGAAPCASGRHREDFAGGT